MQAAAGPGAWLAFTDVAIMGAIALLTRARRCCAPARGADQVIALAASGGAPARAIDGAPGDAVRLKLLRSAS